MSQNFSEHLKLGDNNEAHLGNEQASAYVRETFYPLIHSAATQFPPKNILKLDNGITLIDIDAVSDNTRDRFSIDGILPQIAVKPSPQDRLHNKFYGFSKDGILHELNDGTKRFKDHPVLGTCTVIGQQRTATPASPEACLDILGKLIASKPVG